MKDIPKSPRVLEIKRKRRIKKIRSMIVIFVLFIFGIIILSYLSFNQYVNITQINIEGNNVIDKELLEKNINETLSGKYLHLFSRSNSFLYPRSAIYNSLILNFPRIEEISVSLKNLNTLNVNIKERTGNYLYCGENLPDNNYLIGENCYFLNDDSLIFDKAPYISGNVYFKYYMPISNMGNSDNPLGVQMLDSEIFHNLMRFINGVNSLGLEVDYLVLDNNTYNLYLLHKEEYTSPKIIFNKDQNFDALLDDLSLAMKKKEFSDEIKSKYNNLLYIDLRFKNKVLYKFQ